VARLSVEFGGSPAALTHIGPSQLRGKSLQQELAERYRTAPPCGAGSAWLGGNDSTSHGRGRTIRQ
jgi:hypothetical protein